MIDFLLDDAKSAGTLLLSGSLTIQNAIPLKEALLRAVGEVSQLTINLEQVEKLDLTALQLLCVTQRALLEQGKNVTREGSIPEVVSRIVQESGFSDCVGSGDESGLWAGAND